MGTKCPLKTVALVVKLWKKISERLKWKYRKSLCDELGWKYKMGVKPGDSPRKGEGWRWKAMNEEQQQNEEQQ